MKKNNWRYLTIERKVIFLQKIKNKRSNLPAVLVYLVALVPVIGLVISVLIFLFVKKDKFTRFHAMQAIVVFSIALGVNLILTFSLTGMYLIPYVLITEIAICLFLMLKAYLGLFYKIPLIGSFCEIQLKKLS